MIAYTLLLENPKYRHYWISQAISQVGSWMQNATLPWLVLQMTDSAERLGFVMALLYLPALILVIPAGVVADRYPKRNLLWLTQASMMLLALVIAVLKYLDVAVYFHVAAFTLAYGCLNAIGNPIRLAYNVDMAGIGNSAKAVPLNSLSFNLSRLLGPAIAGFIILKWGVVWAFAANALSFVPLLVFLGFMPAGEASASGKENPFKQALEGLHYVIHMPLARNILLMTLWLGLFAINWHTLVPAYAKLVLHLGADGYGYMMSSMGAGALCGSLWQGLSGRSQPRRMLWGGLAIGLVYLSFLASLEPVWVACLLAVAGFATVTTLTSANSSLQTLAPKHLRGRIMSLYLMVALGTNPIGGYLVGWTFENLGGRTSCGLLGTVSLLGVMGFSFLRWPAQLEPGKD